MFNDSAWTLIPSNQKISDNGQLLVSLPRQTYKKIIIKSGQHILRPESSSWEQVIELNVRAGQKLYVVIGYRPLRSWAIPLAGPPIVMKQLTEEEARALINEMKQE